MTDDERKALVEIGCDTGYAHNFSVMGMPRARAQSACRSLERMGLAAFRRGLFTDDGAPAGAGYAPTVEGVKMRRAIIVLEWWPFCACGNFPADPLHVKST